MRYIDKDLESIQEIRNLLLNGQMSFVHLQKYSQSDLDVVTSIFIKTLLDKTSDYVHEFVTGNDYGVEEDEHFLCTHFLKRFEETLQKESYIGIIGGNSTEKVIEIGAPLGVVAVLLPARPTFTLLVNVCLLAMKTGNSLVFIANRQSTRSTLHSLKKLIMLAEESGYPEDGISLGETISDAGILELLASDKVSLLINIGCPEYISNKFVTNIPLLYGGDSSGPVFVERTANIEKAVSDVIHSRSFQNGILPGAEQFLVTENVIADQIKDSLEKNGAHLLTESETRKLIAFLTASEKNIKENYIGKSAIWLAEQSGISVPAETKVLVSVQDYMNEEDFFSRKLLCPVIVVYLEPDWTLACVKCMNLLDELKMGHTLTIHSKDWKIIREFALVKKVGRIVVNAPTVCVATGIVSNFPTSLILGGITTGKGYSSENITPKHLTYTRQVGFEVNNKS
ncbi:aldehyde dehydrogenase [Streptococcus sp. S784/96/1]|uniref:aldehyde dehydrogenase n=1 Tax=Streptococcus sp. S784/96/1 TaxID=2653499 RepID=UPI0013873C83|nr:aldehyde dehydrogenase [Streptococcus sp. S784/96/1]